MVPRELSVHAPVGVLADWYYDHLEEYKELPSGRDPREFLAVMKYANSTHEVIKEILTKNVKFPRKITKRCSIWVVSSSNKLYLSSPMVIDVIVAQAGKIEKQMLRKLLKFLVEKSSCRF